MRHTSIMRHTSYIMLAFVLLTGVLPAALGQEYARKSVLAEGTWYKMEVREEGMYRLTSREMPNLANTTIKNIGVYGLTGGMLNERNRTTDVNDLLPCPIWIYDGNGNGRFDSEDYLLFYAEGASVWRYDTSLLRFDYQRHAYANTNYYYITTSATNTTLIDTLTASTGSGTAVNKYTAVAVHDNDLVNAYNSGRIYVGEKFSSTVTSRTIDLMLEGGGQNEGIDCRYAFASTNATGAMIRLTLGGESDGHEITLTPGYYEFRKTFSDNGGTTQHFTLTFTPTESHSEGFLDFIELNCLRKMTFDGGQRIYRLKPQMRGTPYEMSTSKSLRLWDVSNAYSVHEIVSTPSNGAIRFGLSSNGVHRIVAFDGSNYLSPVSIQALSNQNLHELQDIDFVIVTHKAYQTQAERLADLHRVEDMMTVAVITDEQIYNEFSSGKQDPMAIRSLMRMLWNRGKQDASLRKPSHLLIFGKGTYDNRNLEGMNETSVVTYESKESYHETNSYGSDDLFGFLDDGEDGLTTGYMDIGIGRLPAHNKEEADHFVDKIERYAHRSDLGQSNIRSEWRTFVTLLADDADPSSPGDTLFTHSAEDLANTIKAHHPQLNIERIYADAYVQRSGAIGSYYPDVNNALTKRMNEGSLLTNYIGHGSMQYIGTERYISMADITDYTNHDQLTFFVSSTCTYGKYDMPGGMCGAEMFLLADGGAVGFISAARPIHHSESFNTLLCDLLLYRENTAGQALRKAKNQSTVSPSITLLGDPALRLSLPMGQVVVTSVNEKEVEEGVNDSVSALASVTITGEVQDADGNRLTDFNGSLYATVFDRETQGRTLANDNEGTEVTFCQQKNVLYKGTTTVENGGFQYTFIVPRDVSYTYGQGRLSHYAHSDEEDAAGSYQHLYFGGFDTSATFAALRPQIRLFLNDTNFRNGGTTDATPTLYALLSDSVGINALGTGLGHDITATIDGKGSSVMVLNDFYKTDIDDSRSGSIRYTLSHLEEGYHTLTLKVWNIYNYSSSATLRFYVDGSGEVTVNDFFAYPNPASGSTQIRVEHNSPDQISHALIEIFNSFGKCVKTFEPAVADGSYVVGPVRWNFTTDNGTLVPNGVYVARLTITTTAGETIQNTTRIMKIQ